jgi:predicted ferric reductase
MWLWYASRATGLISLLVLTAVVLLGISGVARLDTAAWPRFAVARLHRNMSLLILVFLAVHIASAVLDGYVDIRWLDVVVPFTGSYQPLWLGLGAVALDLLVALVVTSLLRVRLGLRAWRGVHRAAYACWPTAVVHGFGIGGKDSTTGWVLGLTLGCVGAVCLGLGWRARTSGRRVPTAAGRR